ncbi:hypothetical protein FGG08_001237 [Glutinoglossum americanum]|uniref:cAMP-dependent protein kinase n=1 Tax=Glutinoglossum americanum TaxID=1670608 RepID=A0A9P8L0E5_9PEZI|nr:hypothetical protein FGG08_001237 [Glutinoglossum americanum]
MEHLDFCPGGEIFGYLRRAKRFTTEITRFYAAEIILILELLHEKEGIAYRDLKPENIMLDGRGHVKLVDFGFAKRVGRSKLHFPRTPVFQYKIFISVVETYTLCGTPEYLSPEAIQSNGDTPYPASTPLYLLKTHTGHGTAVDWIIEGTLPFPPWMFQESRSLISGLCTADRSSRLGNMAGGAAQIKAHPFFNGVDWDALSRRTEPGPIVPMLSHPGDTKYFDKYEDPEDGVKYTDEDYDRYEDEFRDF